MKQHHKPCSDCAFRRDSKPGNLGGSQVQTYIGQCNGQFWIPCHLHTQYNDPNWRQDTEKPQCAGAAIFRANVGNEHRLSPLASSLQREPADTELVFASYAEFVAHHAQVSVEEAAGWLEQITPAMLTMHEMQRPGVNVIVSLKTA